MIKPGHYYKSSWGAIFYAINEERLLSLYWDDNQLSSCVGTTYDEWCICGGLEEIPNPNISIKLDQIKIRRR